MLASITRTHVPLRVLHVDDEPTNLNVLQQLLLALDHKPEPASSAAVALAHLDDGAFDLLLTDIHMPDLDGVALLERVQAVRPDLPVVAVTADVMTRTVADYKAMGFAGVVAKPLMLAHLMRALEIGRAPAAERRFLAIGIAQG